MTIPEGYGVMMVPDPMVKGKYSQDQVIEDQDKRGLMYYMNDLGMLENVYPTP